MGGGSNAIGIFHAFIPDESVRLYGFEAGGEGVSQRQAPRRASPPAAVGVLHGARTYLLQDEDGQTVESHSISAGLDYPAVGPEHSWLHDTGRAIYQPVDDAEAMEAFTLLCRTEGIIPAIESAHALAGALRIVPALKAELGREPVIIVNLSGRGDKDTHTAIDYLGLLTMSVAVRVFARERPALVGYLPAGFPIGRGGIAGVQAMIESGVDLVEMGLPYSDPVMDGPVIQRAAEEALAGGVRTKDVLQTVEAVANAAVPVVVMTYWNPVDRYGVNAFARDLKAAGGAGLITPDLIPDEADEWLSASDEHKLDRIFLVSPSSTDERIAMTASACRGFIYATAVMGVTGARRRHPPAPALVARVAHRGRRAASGVGLGVRDGAQAAEVGPTPTADRRQCAGEVCARCSRYGRRARGRPSAHCHLAAGVRRT